MSFSKKSIVDFIPHLSNLDALELIHSILEKKPNKEQIIIAIESRISGFEVHQELKM